MKKILFLATMLICTSAYTQKKLSNDRVFVRVYNLDRKKIAKGFIKSISENELQIIKGKNSRTINVANIGLIKTRRMISHNIGIGVASGAAAGAILGASTFSYEQSGIVLINNTLAGAIVYGLIGAGVGAGVGALSYNKSKKRKHYFIDGDIEKWAELKESLTTLEE